MPLFLPKMVLPNLNLVWEAQVQMAFFSGEKSGNWKMGVRVSPTPTLGTISDSTIDFLSNAPINEITSEAAITELIIGRSMSNSGWSAFVMIDTLYPPFILERSSAIFTSGNPSKWRWEMPTGIVNSLPLTIGFLP